jgi:hypothetical protein
MLRKWVVVAKASAQKEGGMPAWMSKLRMQSFSVQRIRSAFPFCWDVYGHESQKAMP